MKILAGISGAPGVAQGIVVKYEKACGRQKLTLDEAKEKSIEKTKMLYEKALAELGEEEANIFAAYQMILEDQMLFTPIELEVKNGLGEAEAVKKVVDQMSGILESRGNEYTKQRANDIRYVGDMLIEGIKGESRDWEMPEGSDPVIIAAHELTPVDTMQMDTKRIAGLMTEVGGVTSHTVILAKSLGIPAVVAVEGLLDYERFPVRGFIDGGKGQIILDPNKEMLMELDEKISHENETALQIAKLNNERAATEDGKTISVSINIGNVGDMDLAQDIYYDGVGLMRSEFLFLMTAAQPTFEAQKEAYQQIIDKAWPNEVIIRTLDVGGDKEIPYLSLPKEENPFLGNRGIRLCLRNSDLFIQQLAAIVAAAYGKGVKIMLPMVSTISEIQLAREMLGKARDYLNEKGIESSGKVLLGIMVETPASAVMAKEFARHCDFMSIGTNDLIQYVTCTDRGNSAIQELYSPFSPAVLRLIANTIQAGEAEGVPVSVCGDLAADLRFTELLLGMGLKRFSVPVPMLGRLKLCISKINMEKAQGLAEKVLAAETEEEVRVLLQEVH